MKAVRFWSAFCLVVLVGSLLLVTVSQASAGTVSSMELNRQSQEGGGAEFKVIDVSTPTGRLMSPSQIAKQLRTYISWGFQRYGEPYQKWGRWWQLLRRTAESRGPTNGGGAGIVISWHYDGSCMVYNYDSRPAPAQAWNCDCWRFHWGYMANTYGTAAYTRNCK